MQVGDRNGCDKINQFLVSSRNYTAFIECLWCGRRARGRVALGWPPPPVHSPRRKWERPPKSHRLSFHNTMFEHPIVNCLNLARVQCNDLGCDEHRERTYDGFYFHKYYVFSPLHSYVQYLQGKTFMSLYSPQFTRIGVGCWTYDYPFALGLFYGLHEWANLTFSNLQTAIVCTNDIRLSKQQHYK